MGVLFNQVKVLVKKDLWVLKSHKKSLCGEILLPVLIAAAAGALLWLATNGQTDIQIYGMNYYSFKEQTSSFTPTTFYTNSTGTPPSDSNQPTVFVTPRDWSNLSDPCAPYVPYGQFFYQARGHSLYGTCSYYHSQQKQTANQNYTNWNYYSSMGLNVANNSEDLEDQYTRWYQAEKASSFAQYAALTISTPIASLPMPMDQGTWVGYNSLRPSAVAGIRPMLENLYFGNTTNGDEFSNYSSAPAGLYNMSTFDFDYPPESNSMSMFATTIGILLQLAFLPLAITTGGRLVDEKRTKMREHLRIMGVRPIAYLLSIYGFGVARVTLISVCMFIAFAASQSGLPIGLTIQAMLVQWIFGMSLVSWATLMPCFFAKSIFSAVLSCLFILVFNLGAIFLTDPAVPTGVVWLVCLLFSPSAGIIATAQVLGRFSVTLPVSVGACVAFMVLQTVVYAALSQYLYALNPGEYGVSQHWAFPYYQLKRWLTGAQPEAAKSGDAHESEFSSGDKASTLIRDEGGDDSVVDENGPGKYSIVLEDLYKFYGSQRDTAAVNGLSLNVRKGEIFALLGHNGAGKTTTISMLTGMLEATKYKTASIDGLDLEKDVDKIRHHIGTCPQFDILFEDLSAAQHMEIFAALKGVPNERGTEILEKLALPLDGQKSVTFSGGMKRRLSVACAMVGGSPIVFLDEPSSGLDPMSRRQLWDMIRTERDQGKTIILTTHFMEEADYLGERIAIMSHGRLYCCDTSTALKQKYGVGYYLTIVKAGGEDFFRGDAANLQKHSSSNDEDRPAADGHVVCDTQALLTLCQKHCPGASISQESLGDASILLPSETLGSFGNLLTALEERQQVLGISSYGIRMNSLEDVFVSISEKESGAEGDALDMSSYDTNALEGGSILVEDLFSATVNQSSFSRFFSQVWTIMVKKAMYFGRSKRMIFLGIIVPVVLVVAAWAAAIPLSDGSGQSDYNEYQKSGTKIPDYRNWDIPYFGSPTPLQKSILDRTSAIASERSEFFPHVPAGEKVQLTFPTFDKIEYKNGLYINPRSIAFTSATFSAAKSIILGNVDHDSIRQGEYNAYYGHTDNASAWGMHFDRHYNPAVGVQFFLCLRQAWYEIMMQPNTNQSADVASDLPIYYHPINISVDLDGITPAPTQCDQYYSSSYCNRTKGGGNAFLLVPTGVLGGMAIAQYASSACLQVADELNRHVFQTMRMHGMSALAYWTGTLLFDTLLSFLLIGCMVAGPWVRDVWILEHGEFAVFAALVMFGNVLFILLFNYAYMCYLPNLKPNSHIALMLGSTILFMLLPTLISIAWLTNGHTIPNFVNVMFPQKALLSIYAALPMSEHAIRDAEHPFSSSLGKAVLVSTFNWCLLPIILLWTASTSALRSFKPARPSPGNSDGAPSAASPLLAVGSTGPVMGTAVVDSDVLNEERRVEGRPEEDMTEACHLEKIYPGGKVAVKGVTFGVRRGECFGLLGPNGAGKTTTVKMLLKEHSATYGAVEYPYTTIRPNSGSLDDDYQEARLGVCQQHDTLWETFTAEEHLHLYLRIRLGSSYVKSQWEEYVKNAIKKVYLDPGKKHSSQYSGGMKRKLAVAIALYTGAKTVFLDEPSTGMDPYARRAMWKSIKEALANDRGVILTTHSMEEADAVCARIAIVAQGVMKCIGSSQHLKNKFGTGYAITLLLSHRAAQGISSSVLQEKDDSNNATRTTREKPTDNDEGYRQGISDEKLTELDRKMTEAFKGTERAEVQGNTVQYRIPILNVAAAFSTLSSVADEWGLDSYSVNQVTSLEQIFIGFATQGDADA